MKKLLRWLKSDKWYSQIQAAQENQRRLMAKWDDTCPECGLCNPDFQSNCVHDYCPLKKK